MHTTTFSYRLAIILISCLLMRCDSSPKVEPKDDPKEVVIEPVDPTGNEKYLQNNSDYIFDQNKLHTFELTIPPAELAKIDADPAAEEYVEGSMSFEGETISPVGIRYKGSIGAFVGCLSGNDWANPSGHKTCTKLSMKIKINWNGSDARFYGLKKLQFHSQNLDPSTMRERLGYWLFRQMGVKAPRSVHARLMINGTYFGVYALTEQIDGRFTRYNFADGSGNLYKEIWPLNWNGQAYSEREYLKALKTNEDENPSVDMIRTFAQELAASTPNTVQTVIEKWIDVDKIIAYAAVDRTIKVDDGAFHWYCEGLVCTNHNYYWYEEPTEKSMHLIPWDMDNTFENLVYDKNPVTPIRDDWGETTAYCKPFRHGSLRLFQRSAACDKLIAGWASYTDKYEQTLTQFKQGPFSESQVLAQLNAWEQQIRPAIIEASQKHDDAISISEWEDALDELKAGLKEARER